MENPRMSFEKEIIKRNCINCKNLGLSPKTRLSHISSNKNCPSRLVQIVSSKKPENIIKIEKTKNLNKASMPLRSICEKERSTSIKVVNSILGERSIEDMKEKMNLPTIPKKKIPLNEEVFYNSPVKVYVPEKKEEKALTVLKMKREKLMKSCRSETPTNDQRGSHFKEAGCLQRKEQSTGRNWNLLTRIFNN